MAEKRCRVSFPFQICSATFNGMCRSYKTVQLIIAHGTIRQVLVPRRLLQVHDLDPTKWTSPCRRPGLDHLGTSSVVKRH